MSYPDETQSLARRSEAAVLAAFAAYETAAFITTGAAVVASFNAAATALADMALASIIKTLPLGLARPLDELDRLVRAFTTLGELIADDEPEAARAKVARIARAEPLDAGREAFQAAMKAHPEVVIGWRRQTQPGACERCLALADGTVLATDSKIIDHPGCNCVAVPVTRKQAA
jgi:hypothetical protein